MDQPEIFPPAKHFSEKAHIRSMEQCEALYKASIADPEKCSAEQGKTLHWFSPWEQVLDWSNPPFAKWFIGGKTNVAYNCIDRHLASWRRTKAAIIWEGENFEQRILTYQELHRRVAKLANALKKLGLKSGDRSIIYMPMIPEAAIAMLACALLGITHSVVFGGFSAEALKARIPALSASLVIPADAGLRGGKEIPVKPNVDEALPECPTVKHQVVFRRLGTKVEMKAGRDHWWHELTEGVSEQCPAEPLDSEHPLYVLYTSGTTGKPKGVVRTTGGYLTQVQATMNWGFDIEDEDIYWCTADVGWVTGHSYVVYGPLANGATTFMYEGAPNWPEPDRFWKIIEQNRINRLYTAPTAICAFIRGGDQWVNNYDWRS